MTRIVVVGDVMWDVVVRPHEPIAVGSDTPSSIAVTRGGAAANVAVALRAALTQPADVVYVGCRGADAMGERFERELERSGVIPALATASAPTGTLVSMVDDRGDRTMLTDRGANAFLEAEAVVAQLDDLGRRLFVEATGGLRPGGLFGRHRWGRRGGGQSR